VERHVVSLCAMISRIMAPRPVSADTIAGIDCHIKIFLSCVENLDCILHGGGDKPRIPWWFTHSNYMCLLRIPPTMKQFGSLRDYWEGSLCGEKYLQRIKPLIHGVRPGDQWLKSTMEKIYDWDTLTGITDAFNGDDDGDDDDETTGDNEDECDGEEEYKRYDSVRITKNRGVTDALLETGEDPISGFVAKSEDGIEVMVIPYKTGRTGLGYRRVVFDDLRGAEEVGLWYAPVAFEDPHGVPSLPEKKSTIRLTSVRSFILEPGKKGCYCAIADDWTE
jgi:hypothetical protein